MVGWATARRMRSGTGLGPGTWRKWRPVGWKSSVGMVAPFGRGGLHAKCIAESVPRWRGASLRARAVGQRREEARGSVMSSASVRHHASAAGTTLPPSDACETLARRLRAETRGEVLFDAASRGRYATDASIYQIMPVGVFVPTGEDDIAIALQVAGQLGVPVLPRGAGTSQCGQTVGAALVIDNSRHIRGILSVDVDARVAEVEPGLVLDELNRALRRHGLWFPVDVSTSAQATLGGMAGNNSCGSRSIAYGNMVHNVLGVRAWMADGELLRFGPVAQASGRAARIAEFVAGLVRRHRTAIHENWPTVMRRVGGYNRDIFDNRSERPYTADGSVNLAHLLVGSE